MFNRKKPRPGGGNSASEPRGRTAAGAAQPAQNPLARRFLDDAEPDTVDLAEPGRFHAPPGADVEEPDTRETGGESADARDLRQPLITLDAATGKLYLQPGTDAQPVRLNGVTVEAPTELRRGDRLQVGVHEFEFLA
ncbi:MAG: FHA domain-containing protein [Xanthomonadales bacterium]